MLVGAETIESVDAGQTLSLGWRQIGNIEIIGRCESRSPISGLFFFDLHRHIFLSSSPPNLCFSHLLRRPSAICYPIPSTNRRHTFFLPSPICRSHHHLVRTSDHDCCTIFCTHNAFYLLCRIGFFRSYSIPPRPSLE